MSVQLGLPSQFLPKPEIAMSNGCKSTLVRVQPNNVSQVQSAAQTASGTASAVNNAFTFPSQLVQFSIPAGSGRHVWLDTTKSTLAFRSNYAVTAAGTPGATADGSAYLMAGAASWWNRIVHIGPTGATLDDVVNLNMTEHLDNTLNYQVSDRDGFGIQQGFLAEGAASSNLVQGHSITSLGNGSAVAVGNGYYQYEIPLPSSLLGKYAKGFLPIGSLSKLDLQLYTNSSVPVIMTNSSTTTAGATVQFTIDQIALNLFYIELDDDSVRLLGAPKVHYVHGVTQRTAGGQINSGSSGYQNILIGLRAKSVRQLFARFSESALTTAGSVNGIYDSKMPLATQMNYLIAGKDRFPRYPHNTQYAPASVLARALMASERYKPWAQHSSFVPSQFCKYLATGSAPTAAGGYDANVVAAGSTTAANNLATFVFGEDCRVASSSEILDGIDLTTSSSHFLELTLAAAPSNTVNVYFSMFCDIIYEIDMDAGIITYRM